MGGEKLALWPAVRKALGSPPRRRGKDKAITGFHSGQRITPACAGKRSLGLRRRTAAQDHPRMGGEKTDDHLKGLRDLGSPPRGRGKVGHNQIAGAAHGITPAWTGKRVHEYKSGRFARDHPRVGGGKVHQNVAGRLYEGITPAWAGKSLFCFTAAVPIQDHPAWAGKRFCIRC